MGVLVLPEPPCAVVAVPLVLVLHRSHLHPTKEQPKRGVGVFIFVLHLRGLLQLPSFFRCGCTHGPLLLVVISQNRRGHNHAYGGGMARFRLRFRVCSMSRTKIGPPKKLKNLHFMTPCYMLKTKRDMCIYDRKFSPISYGF